jgi:hypothetical protein
MLPASTLHRQHDGKRANVHTRDACIFGVDDPPTPPRGCQALLTAGMGPKPGKYPHPTGGYFSEVTTGRGKLRLLLDALGVAAARDVVGVAGASCVSNDALVTGSRRTGSVTPILHVARHFTGRP